MTERDPAAQTFRHARQEAVFALIVWFLALTWTVGYCYLHGYQHEPDALVVRWGWAEPRSVDNFRTVAGIPDWVVYGIVMPWVACTIITIVFALGFMHDDDLGAIGDTEGSHADGH